MHFFPCFYNLYSVYYMYMNMKKLIKMVKENAKKFLKSRDGKNYVKLLKQQKNNDNLIFVKGVN